jgi:hypothetical protein
MRWEIEFEALEVLREALENGELLVREGAIWALGQASARDEKSESGQLPSDPHRDLGNCS